MKKDKKAKLSNIKQLITSFNYEKAQEYINQIGEKYVIIQFLDLEKV
ncbi:MAG: hypothetical protein FWB86_12520 [Treponema sp.]|nr:hypothetical protein [Treponema sp.]MCL2252449.1 hypothetical protein [Treponema sp.]